MKNGWINLNINKARSGNFYVELDTWEPSEKKEKAVSKSDDLPF